MNDIQVIIKTLTNFNIETSKEITSFLKNISEISLDLEKGIIYDSIGNIEYSAIPTIFYRTGDIIDNYKYPTLSNEDSEEERKYFLPFAEDISGRNIFFICLQKEDFGKIVFHESDYIFDLTFKKGTWVIASCITEFLSKIINQNQDNNKIDKLQEIYDKLK